MKKIPFLNKDLPSFKLEQILATKQALSRREIISQLMPFIVLISLMLAIGVFQPSFLSLYTLRVLAEESSMVLLLSTALTIAILLGGIDLSIAANASLMTVLLIFWLPKFGLIGLLLGLVITTGIGLIQGYIKSKSQVPSFIITLAGGGIITGVAMLITTRTLSVTQGYDVVGWMASRSFEIPNSFIIALFIVGMLSALMHWTPLGRHIYAIGLSESAALMSGVKVERIRVLSFALAGFIAGITGALLVARSHSGNYNSVNSLLLPSIAAVVVGGSAITGGYGNLGRTIIGALSITVMRVGIALIGVDPGFEPLAYGILIIVAVALTIDRSKIKIVK